MTREGVPSAQGQSVLQLETHILPSRACSSLGPYSDGHMAGLICSTSLQTLVCDCVQKGQGEMATGRALSQPQT